MNRRSPARFVLGAALALAVSVLELPAEGRPGDGQHHTCGGCHLKASPYPAAEPDRSSDGSESCVRCHGRMDVQGSPSSPRGEISHLGMTCLGCHSNHPNGRPYQIREVVSEDEVARREGETTFAPAAEICLSCHGDAAGLKMADGHYGRHPVGICPGRPLDSTDGGAELPLADVANTVDPADDVIACWTCHSVHSSRYPALLRWTRDRDRAACGACHTEVVRPDGAMPILSLVSR